MNVDTKQYFAYGLRLLLGAGIVGVRKEAEEWVRQGLAALQLVDRQQLTAYELVYMYTVMAETYLSYCRGQADAADEICSHGIAVARHAGLGEDEARLALLLAKSYEEQGERKKAMDTYRRYLSRPDVAVNPKLTYTFALRLVRVAESEAQVLDAIQLLDGSESPQVRSLARMMRVLRFMRAGNYLAAREVLTMTSTEEALQNCYTGALYYMTLLQCDLVLGLDGPEGRAETLLARNYEIAGNMVAQLVAIRSQAGGSGPPFVVSVDASGINDIAMEWTDLGHAIAVAQLVLLSAAVCLGDEAGVEQYAAAVEASARESPHDSLQPDPAPVVALARLVRSLWSVTRGDLGSAADAVQRTKRITAPSLRALRRYVCGLIFQLEGHNANAISSFDHVGRGPPADADDLGALAKVQALILRGPTGNEDDEMLFQRLAASPNRRVRYFGELVKLAYNETRQPIELTRRQASQLLMDSSEILGPQLTAISLYCALRLGLGAHERLHFAASALRQASRFHAPQLQSLIQEVHAVVSAEAGYVPG